MRINYKVQNKNNINLISDLILLVLLFLISIIIIYYSPQIIKILFQIVLLFLFYKSDKSYFWFSFIFIIESYPGGLFSRDDPVNKTFVLFKAGNMGELLFVILFIIVAFYKFKNKNIDYEKYFLKEILILLFYYLFILFIYHGIGKISNIVRLLLPWLLLYIIPRAFKDEYEYYKFFFLLFPFVFFVIYTNLFSIDTGLYFSTKFGGMGNQYFEITSDVYNSGLAIRILDGIFIPFLTLIGALYFLLIGKNYKVHFSEFYLMIIVISSNFAIFLTATRAWFVASLFISITTLLIYSKKPIRFVLYLAIILFCIYMFINLLPFLNKQIYLAMQRIKTVEYLLQGDLSAGGTAIRFDYHANFLMEKFNESPLLGWGFGKEGLIYSDGHVGHQNLLMNIGIIGYILFLIFWFIFIYKMFHTYILLRFSNFKKIPLFLIIVFLGIHIINVTAQWFNYLVGFSQFFILAIIFSLANNYYWKAKNNNY